MKLFLISFIIMCFNFVAFAQADESEELYSFIGSRMVKVFNSLGCPTDVYGTGTEGNYEAILDYSNFFFKVNNKTVVMVGFANNYSKSIKGVYIGDEREKAEQKLGKPDKAFEYNEVTFILSYPQKDLDCEMFIWIDIPTNKVRKITFEI